MSEIPKNIELLKLLYNSDTDRFFKYKDKTGRTMTQEYMRKNNIKGKWFISVMQHNTLLSPFISFEETNTFLFPGKTYKYKQWGFKNEFLKAYDYFMKIKLYYTVLPADPTNCPYCPKHKENHYNLYVIHIPTYGNFCWGTLLWHLVLEHDYKPPRFFIEFIYYVYCKAIYGLEMNIIKLDENTLKYFEIMSRTGYEKKFGFKNGEIDYKDDTYNIVYNGNIIAECSNITKKATTVKTRIDNIGVLFGKAEIQNNNIVLYDIETDYEHSNINYIYYVHPYNHPVNIEDPEYYDKFKIDIPYYEEYLSIIDLYQNQNYTKLLGLLIFANEGVYVVSKIKNNKNIDINKFDQQKYQKIIRDTEIEYSRFIEIFKRNLNKDFLSDLTDAEKKYCYEQYRYIGSWIKKINDCIKLCNFKVLYFPKLTIKKSEGNEIVSGYDTIYDTLYLPINTCNNFIFK